MNTRHPELEELATLADAEPAPADTADTGETVTSDRNLRSHVESCDKCSADLAALRSMRATLRSLPAVTMPDDVARRIESALRDAVSTPTKSASAISILPASGSKIRAHPTNRPSWLPNTSVAAAITIFLVVALGVGIAVTVRGGGNSSKSASTAAGGATGLLVTASGTDYTPQDIREQIAHIVLAHVPDAHTQYKGLAQLTDATSADKAASGAAVAESAAPMASAPAAAVPAGTPGSNSAPSAAYGANATPSPSLEKRMPLTGPLGDPAQLQACVRAILNQPATPVLVDYAYFAGAPATVIVLRDPTDPSTLDVYVEADTSNCTTAGDVTYVQFLRHLS